MSDQYQKPLNTQNQFTAQDNSTPNQNLNGNYQAPPINNQNIPINPIPNQAGVNNNYQNATQGYNQPYQPYNYQPNYQYYNNPNPNFNAPQANYQVQYQQQYGPPQNVPKYYSNNARINNAGKMIFLIFFIFIAIFGIAAILLSLML